MFGVWAVPLLTSRFSRGPGWGEDSDRSLLFASVYF